MSDFLEITLDKFTFKVATDRFYSSEGVWVKEDKGRIRIGLSDFVQQVRNAQRAGAVFLHAEQVQQIVA